MAAVGVVALVAVVLAAVLATADAGDGGPARRSGAAPSFVEAGPAEVGGAAPDFVLPGLGGGRVALADYAGQPVVLNLWASWCNPCREEFPLLGDARERHADDGLEVIGVSYRDIAGDGRAFAADQDARWPLARDPDGRLAEAYGVRAIPQTFFIARDGTIASRVFGITSAEDLETEIAEIVAP